MKKLLLFSSTLILMLTFVGCSSNNNEETSETVSPKNSIQEEKFTENQSRQEKEEVGKNEDLSELKEFPTIKSQVYLTDLTGTVSLNNLRKRIIIFKDHNQREKYKTIFVKSKKC